VSRPRRESGVCPGVLPSYFPRKLVFFFFFFSCFLLTAAQESSAEEPSKIVLERVVDGRGNRVCDIASASVKTGEARVHVRLVRGLVRSDLVLRHEARRGTEGREITVDEIRLGGGAPMRFEISSPGGRVAASSPVSTFRYFDRDVARKTVRCNLARLAEETDHILLSAVADYVEQGLEDDGLAPEELPIFTLHAVEKRPPLPSPPVRKKWPLSADLPEAGELKAAVLAALGARERLPGQAAEFARAPVDGLVLLGRAVPREVLVHAVPDDASPDLAVKEDALGPEDRRRERMR
jgi:hypothetical protein